MLILYLCFLAGGAVLPFVSFLLGSLGEGIDTDVNTDVDVGTDTDIQPDFDIGSDVDSVFSIGLFPSSLMALSALAITFGAVGSIMTYTGKGKVLTFVAAILAGYVASVLIQTLIKTLKRVQNRSYGVDENELLLYDGKVVDTILPGQLGTVSFTTLNNVLVSYPARCSDENLKLESGKIVKAAEIKNGVIIVEAKNKYEN